MKCNSRNIEFIHFLQNEMAVSAREISVLQHHHELDEAPFTMLLWQYGLVSLDQLAQIFDWLEARIQTDLEPVFVPIQSTYS